MNAFLIVSASLLPELFLAEASIFIVDNMISDHIENEQDTFYAKKNILGKVNQQIRDSARSQYEKEYQEFRTRFQSLVHAQSTKTKEIDISDFQIHIQQDCSLIDLPPPVKPSLLEGDCFTGQFMASVTARLIANVSPTSPPDAQSILQAVNSCELDLGWTETLSIEKECYAEDLSAEYRRIVDDGFESLGEEFGFEHKGGNRFERDMQFNVKLHESKAVVNRSTPNELVPLP